MDQTEHIPVKLASGTTIQIEVSQSEAGREDVSGDIVDALPFEKVTNALQEIVGELKETLDRVKPDKATVKFGIEIGAETSGLTTMIAKGSGKGNLEITLEWGK